MQKAFKTLNSQVFAYLSNSLRRSNVVFSQAISRRPVAPGQSSGEVKRSGHSRRVHVCVISFLGSPGLDFVFTSLQRCQTSLQIGFYQMAINSDLSKMHKTSWNTSDLIFRERATNPRQGVRPCAVLGDRSAVPTFSRRRDGCFANVTVTDKVMTSQQNAPFCSADSAAATRKKKFGAISNQYHLFSHLIAVETTTQTRK